MRDKSENEKWLENFLTRTGIDSPRRTRRQPERKAKAKNPQKMSAAMKRAESTRRRKRIDEHGLCKTCQVCAVSSGGTEAPEGAKDEGQCLKCYNASRRRGPGRPRELDPSEPICVRCSSSNVTRGASKTAGYARRARLCIRCYCSGKER
jgi:hypothetical protein